MWKSCDKHFSSGPNKGYCKVWQKEEVYSTIRLEKSMQGHLQTSKPIVEHLPGRRAKQISDKHREPSYKVLVELYT